MRDLNLVSTSVKNKNLLKINTFACQHRLKTSTAKYVNLRQTERIIATNKTTKVSPLKV